MKDIQEIIYRRMIKEEEESNKMNISKKEEKGR